MTIKITSSGSLTIPLTTQNHRGAIVVCPHCNVNIGHDSWFKTGIIKEIMLQSEHNKSNTAIVTSECPKCFELSWIHKKLKALAAELSKSGLELLAGKVLEEVKYRKERVKDMQKNSICMKCQLLININIAGEHINRKCQYGRGQVLSKCNKFKQKKD